MSTIPQDILDTILGRLKTIAGTETVVGEPLSLGEVTLLPVVKISIGFAAGGGEGSTSSSNTAKGTGGGGGGASVTPVGFIVWDGDKVQFIGLGKGKIESLMETVPDLLRKFGITKMGQKAEKKGEGGGKKKRRGSGSADEEE